MATAPVIDRFQNVWLGERKKNEMSWFLLGIWPKWAKKVILTVDFNILNSLILGLVLESRKTDISWFFESLNTLLLVNKLGVGGNSPFKSAGSFSYFCSCRLSLCSLREYVLQDFDKLQYSTHQISRENKSYGVCSGRAPKHGGFESTS